MWNDKPSECLSTALELRQTVQEVKIKRSRGGGGGGLSEFTDPKYLLYPSPALLQEIGIRRW